ncbi:MAG: ubiquinol-cytochrome C chaperone family protein [Rhizomicrobium sp.]
MLKALRRAAARRRTASELAIAIVRRGLSPSFYRLFAVPDTFNGRFDMVSLHAFLVLSVLEGDADRDLSQDLVNALFHSFEDALRDQGAGDMGMTRRIQKIAGAFYGRLEAYRAASTREELAAVLLRNIYGEDGRFQTQAFELAAYMERARLGLEPAMLAAGVVAFAPLPDEEG